MKQNILPAFVLFFIAIPIVNGLCCINPNAGTDYVCECDPDWVTQDDCCPPYSPGDPNFDNYYSDDPTDDIPNNQQDCIDSYFVPATTSAYIDACAYGCCCGVLFGEDIADRRARGQCVGDEVAFYLTEEDCADVCEAPEEEEPEVVTPECDVYNALSNLNIEFVRGEKQAQLSWEDSCAGVLGISKYIVRREGGTVPYEVTSRVYVDSSDTLFWNTDYTYTIKAYYSRGQPTPAPSITSETINLGDFECWKKYTNDPFCILEEYYEDEPYFTYYTEIHTDIDIGHRPEEGKNRAYYCDAQNNLKWTVLQSSCTPPSVCIISQDIGPTCAKTQCASNDPDYDGGLFEMFWTQQTCELDPALKPKYCFYDASATTIDDCYKCKQDMGCYDYKTKAACLRDNCGAGDCDWHPIYEGEDYPGVCVDNSRSNCYWCNLEGTDGVLSRTAYNDVFDPCTEPKAKALSVNTSAFKDKCFYDPGPPPSATSCSNARCILYPSQTICDYDPCGIDELAGFDACKWYSDSGQCRKDADYLAANDLRDPQPDCFDPEIPSGYDDDYCEPDFFPPNSTLIPNIFNNIHESFNVVFKDRKVFDGPELSTMEEGDRICIVVQDSAPTMGSFTTAECIELSIEAEGSYILHVAGELCDGADQRCWTLADNADNTIWYFAQDSNKNIEQPIKSITFWYSAEQTPPKVFEDLITVGGKSRIIGETRYYTNNNRALVSIPFMEPTVISEGAAEIDPGDIVPGISPAGGIGEIFEFDATADPAVDELGDGEYTLTLYATKVENQRNQVTMPQNLGVVFVVDTIDPTITDRGIQNNALFTKDDLIKGGVVIDYSFDEDVRIVNATLNGQDITDTFVAGWGQDFTSPQPDLPDGLHRLHLKARDKAGNMVIDTVQFIVDALETNITLVQPSYGVSPTFDFTLEITTDNEADCRYSIDFEQGFSISTPLTPSADGTSHTRTITEIYDENDHQLFVKCYSEIHGEGQKVFPLRVDTTAPVLNSYPYPDPTGGTTILKVESDDQVICKYGTSSNYDIMEAFEDYNKSDFKLITQQIITIEQPGTRTYYITCENEAELSSTDSFPITMDPDLQFKAADRTQSFMTGTAMLSVETNKEATCIYSTNPRFSSPDYFGPSGFFHKAELFEADDGAHTYYVRCVSGIEQSNILQIDFILDNTPPEMISVDDTNAYLPAYPEQTCNQAIRVWWVAEEDDFTGIIAYNISLIDADGTIVLKESVDPDSVDTAAGVNVHSLDGTELPDGATYSFEIIAQNEVGLWSKPMGSDGVTTNSTLCALCSNAKDGCCDAAIDNTCDPDCMGTDPNCKPCTSFPNDCCFPFPDEICDPDCNGYRPFLDYIDCMRECGSGILDAKACESVGSSPIFHDYPSSCADYDIFIGGTLQCSSDCNIDTTGCIEPPHCNDGVIDPGEQCDSIFFGAIYDCGNYYEFKGGGSLPCMSNCYLDTTICDAVSKCGNGIIDRGESCDGDLTNIGLTTCTEYYALFTSGNLKCTNCEIDASDCRGPTGACGNGIIQVGEECEKGTVSDIFGNVDDCLELGFLGGKLSCSNECKLDTTKCIGEERCGNGIVDPGETCDGDNFGDLTSTDCIEYSAFFSEGTLSCTDDCQIDTLGCVGAETCGNGIIDDEEQCDGDLFIGVNDNLCTSFSEVYIEGTLICDGCTAVDTSECEVEPLCGDGIISGEEICDAGEEEVGSCAEAFLGIFMGGTYACTDDCSNLDTINCIELPPCGNGVIDSGEQCDDNGPAFGLYDECTDYEIFVGGSLGCTDCIIDKSGCEPEDRCGNGEINMGEQCDGAIFGGIVECSDLQGFQSGTLTCTADCKLDTSNCVEEPACGNGLIDAGESCDGSNFGPGISQDCTTFSSDFTGGTLACTADCSIDTSTCEGMIFNCGDGFIGVGEQCDTFGPVFGAVDECDGYSEFTGGALACNDNCELDTSGCVEGPSCGNGLINRGETCDGANLGGVSTICSVYSAYFSAGTISCSDDCQISTNGCQEMPTCNNGIVDGSETCDGNLFLGGGSLCSDFSAAFCAGDLECDANCEFDTSACVSCDKCGNYMLNAGEECDPPYYGFIKSDKCADYSPAYLEGTLGCTLCQLDTSSCITVPACGDGKLDPGEQCDSLGPVFTAIDECTDFSIYTGGTLKCSANCTLDTTKCDAPAYCGDSKIDPQETCDKDIDTPVFGSIALCTDFDEFERGDLSCSPACALDTSDCIPAPLCGNGLIDPGEACDGDNLGGLTGTCSEYNPGYFQQGTFGCDDCEIDTSACLGVAGVCGDGIVNPGEDCDGSSFGIIDRCDDYPEFVGGALSCDADCKLDTTACTPGPLCGNGLIDPGEECDGDNLGPLSDCVSLSPSFFGGGTLSCNDACKLDTSLCDAKPGCGNGVINPGEDCDGDDFGNLPSLNCADISTEYAGGTVVCSNACTIDYAQCISNGTADCTINHDGCCWGQNDTICDPDCAAGEDPDCANCTPFAGDCCSPSLNNLCDPDCVFGVDPDCADPCVQTGTCENGHTCQDDTVCASGWCDNGVCATPGCDDGIENGYESDVDCGGSCSACENGKECNRDSDCLSDYCKNGFCSEPSDCENGVFSDGESDVDCGGPCPGCEAGRYCTEDGDCIYGAECINSMCTLAAELEELDSDGDGMPDEWERAHGLDPNDPYDAFGDNDGDGLTNLEEYQYGTDPNNPDTDGDGYTDKEEVDAGTDPLDAEEYPERKLWWILLLILIILVILALIGYLVYILWGDKIKEKIAIIMKKPVKPAIRPPYRPIRPPYRPMVRPPIGPAPPKPVERKKEISKLADVFGLKKIGEEKAPGKPATIFDRLKAIAAKEEKPVEKAGVKEKPEAAKPGAPPEKPLSPFEKLKAIAAKEEAKEKKPEAAKPGAPPAKPPAKPLSPFEKLKAIAAKEEGKPLEVAKPVKPAAKPAVVKPRVAKPKPIAAKPKEVKPKKKAIKPIKPVITKPAIKPAVRRAPAKRKRKKKVTVVKPEIKLIVKPEIKVKAPTKKKKPKSLEETVKVVKKVTKKGAKTTKTVKKEVKKAPSGDVFKKLSKLSKKK